MKQSTAMLLLLVSAVLPGVASAAAKDRPEASSPQGSQSPSAIKPVAMGEWLIGAPVRHGNLTVFPIAAKRPRNEDRYITLEEGLRAGKVRVYEIGAERPAGASRSGPGAEATPARQAPAAARTQPPILPAQEPRQQPARSPAQSPAPSEAEDESSDEADVNRLMVVNKSGKPLYLMPGEIIYGGEQDRCVGQESIVAADGKPVEIEVYCVEAGRWEPRDEAETAAGVRQLAQQSNQRLDEAAGKKLAKEAKQGRFVMQAGSLNKAGRVAVQSGKGQGEVWNRVAQSNRSISVQPPTGAFTANFTSPEALRLVEPYVKAIERPVAEHKQVVGAMAAIDGKIEAVDVFVSTPLFKKLWPKLLRSHALDAAAAARDQPGKAAKAATLADAEKFFRAAMLAEVQQKTPGQGDLVVIKRESKEVISFSAREKTAGAMGGMGGMSGFGGSGSVHSAGYSK